MIGGSIVHGTVSSAAVIIILLVGWVGVKRGGDWGSIVHGTVSSAAVIIILLVGWVRCEERS